MKILINLFFVILILVSCQSSPTKNDASPNKEEHHKNKPTIILNDTITTISKNRDNDLENERLFGSVKTMKKSNSSPNDFDVINYFRIDGNFDYQLSYDEVDSLFQKTTYVYQENRLIQITYESEYYQILDFFLYDNNGNNITIITTEDTVINEVCNYIYNSSNQLIEKRIEESNNVYTSAKFKYFKNGLLEKSKFFLPSGYLFNHEILEYNNENSIVKTSTYNSQGKLTNTWLYKYDNYGNTTNEENLNPQGKIIDVFTYDYIYDSYGNWISKQEYEYLIPTKLTKREITYYN